VREYFNLMEYTEEFINKIIDYRMHMDKELNRYLSYEEIAERENCSADEVKKILTATAIVWIH
jgi:DNA-directed RNA polymerase specialized sigma subunit